MGDTVMMTVMSNAQQYDWPTWWIGIMRAFISGGSSAMVSGLTSMGIAPGTFNLTTGTGNIIKLMMVMFLFQGFYRLFEFLQLHGAPEKVTVVTQKKEAVTQPIGDGVVKQTEMVTTVTKESPVTKE